MTDAPSPADLPDAAIAANLGRIGDRIGDACHRAGRDPAGVTLVAVSKTHPAAAVLAAAATGQAVFGENRVQEAAAKFAAVREARPGVRLHLIGALQTNKARDAVRVADVIESLDRPKLAAALAEAMRREGRTPGLLLQVNVGDEAQKGGVPRAGAADLLRACREEHGLTISGLMAIPPAEGDPRPHFAWLANLAAREGLATLSMGMSGDFEAAIAEGATHVRVGTAIFGSRPYPAG